MNLARTVEKASTVGLRPGQMKGMSDRELSTTRTEPFSSSPVLDLVLTAAFFVLSTLILRSHVPSENPAIIWGVAAFTAGSMAGVFYLVWHMFKQVRNAEKETRGANPR
ncbi:MAG: hypothetical protein EA425_16565 [Puniceicoccaceae bacterium]|nr:MAG: hypothetical protein EA425_16565 [Puniceicoccaceae bacterium]